MPVSPPNIMSLKDHPLLTSCVGSQVSGGPGAPAAGPHSPDAVGLLARAHRVGLSGTP
jgi:hypothetical protein